MFERAKIGSSLSYLLRCSRGANTLSISDTETFFSSFTTTYADVMKRQKLSADQAAVLMISKTFSGIDEETWKNLQISRPAFAEDLGRLVLGCAALASGKPDTFSKVFVAPSFNLRAYFS